ncbi:Sec63 Brl domain-containing protein [Mycena sp. CBHHK59/15]|nr:Sec63 Brl domain-containing protein [Mycena sp. CBHHK59/15]
MISSHHQSAPIQRQSNQYQISPPQQRPSSFRAPEPRYPPAHRGSNPRNSTGIRLRPVSELPDMYRGIFKFGVFNAVQSSCFDTVVLSDENMVISPFDRLAVADALNLGYKRQAPTGSGKTALFELAVIRMLRQAKQSGESMKCVYMAPTKALCSERQRDWTSKFDALGIKCCELTGDTVQFGKGAWGDAKGATIMRWLLTTLYWLLNTAQGEKWDSLTRNWSDHGHILSQIQLFLVDEVHILNESRGSTLEVVISRMKTRGSRCVPNIQDIAHWIGNKGRDSGAAVFEFGEDFRPCKLTRHVVGVPRHKNENDFAFTRRLDFKLFAALQTHSVGKPILVVMETAQQLQKEYSEAESKKQALPWTHPKRQLLLFPVGLLGRRITPGLITACCFGIGIHHAGLTIDDRRAVEDLYHDLHLAAHTVVIKGVQIFQNNASVEYSDLDVMQMLGRAGRPQFDKEGIAIILCETELEGKYRELVQGKTILESCLHTNLSEHINSEIGLGTITNIRSAKEWLRNSFLFQRIQKNPVHYALGKDADQSWEDRVDDMVMQSVAKLRETDLIAGAEARDTSGALSSTEFGDIMSKFYIRQSTMGLILALPERPTLRDIPLNKLRKHNDIRFEIKKIEKTADKVFLLIQAVLGGIPLSSPEYKSNDSQPHLEAFSIFKHISRIARVVVEVAIVKKRGAQLKYGLELVRCLTAKAWEDRPVVLRQIESIGEKSLVSYVLAENKITSFDILRKQETWKIETLLNRRPPYGHEVLASVNELPQYTLAITEVEVSSNGGKDPVEVELSIKCGLLVEPLSVPKAKKQKGRYQMTAILTLTSDMEMIDFRRIPTKVLKETKSFEITAELTKPSQSVVVCITSDLDLAGLEDDPDFWNMDVDEHGDEIPSNRITTSKQRNPLPRSFQMATTSISISCKDKTKCRHMWCVNRLESTIPMLKMQCSCRDGLPQQPKKRTMASSGNSKTERSPAPSPPLPIKPKKANNRPDSTMQDLERLHERTNVSLKLPEGGRLKLEPASDLKRKRKPANFDVELSQLDHQEPSISFGVADLDDDDDDLPMPHELLKSTKPAIGKQESSPKTDYSDSEIDSLIRNAPSDLMRDMSTKASMKATQKQLLTPSPPRKYNRNSDYVLPPPKRSRLDFESRKEASSPAGRSERIKVFKDVSGFPRHDHAQVETQSTLFIDVSDDEPQPPGDRRAQFSYSKSGEKYREDDFVLDSDILPTTPALTFNSVSEDEQRTTSDISMTGQVPARGSPQKTMDDLEQRSREDAVAVKEEQNADLDEFEAWLNSGAVEII